MVLTLSKSEDNKIKVNLDDGHEPLNNISYGHFWAFVKVLESRSRPITVRLQNYTGKFLPEPSPDPPENFDDERPYDHSINRFTEDGVLLLDTKGGYDFDTHGQFYERHRIITFAGQTGDVPHVAAALAADPLTDVLLLTNPDIAKNQVEDILATFKNAIKGETHDTQHSYERLHDVDSRVQVEYCAHRDDSMAFAQVLRPLAGEIGQPTNIFAIPQFKHLWTYTNDYGGRAQYVSVSVVGSTYIIAKAFERLGAKIFYDLMSTRLTSPDAELSQEAIMKWAEEAKETCKIAELLMKPRQNVLFVWSRYSGQNTEDGYNPAGDSDPEGQVQLLKIAGPIIPNVLTVTIGHDSLKWGPTPKGDIHLGEFWKIPNTPFCDKGRPGQTSLYVALRERHDVVQIGQKTGGMDNAALVGIPAVYIEDKQSVYKERMQRWEKVMNNRYCCAFIDSPPTPLGKALRHPDVNPMDSPKKQRIVANSLLKSKPDSFSHKYINGDYNTIQITLDKVWKSREI